jgi:hypothetical protein
VIKRGLFVVWMWMMLAMCAFGQHTTVSGTITDAGGQSWAFGTYKISFFSNALPGPFFLAGAPFDPGTTFSGALNSSGSFSGVSVPSSNFITPVGTAWFVTVCPAATSACFTKTIPITGATMNLTGLVVPPALNVPANQYNQAAAYQDSQIVGPYLGFTYYNLTDSTLHVCTGATACTWVSVSGGGTNILPLNNTFTGTLNTFNGVSATSFTDVGMPSSTLPICPNGAGGAFTTTGCVTGPSNVNVNGTPVSSPNFSDNSSVTFSVVGSAISANAISSVFTGGTVTNSTTFLSNLFACGVNPWADTTCANMRAVSSVPSTTATVSGTTTVTLSSGAGFQNNDGIVIYKAGPTSTVAQPSSPSVTPSLARAGMNTGHAVPGLVGSVTYAYCDASIDRAGGFSAGSATNQPVISAVPHSGSAGTGFSVGDTLSVVGGGGSGAVIQVLTVSGGVPTSYFVSSSGSGYVTTSAATLTVLTGSGTAGTADITAGGITITGAATLGPVASIAVSTVTRANNVMTFNTTGASGLAPNATFYYANGSDATFSGQYIVVSTPTTSQFTALQGQDTRGGNSVTTSATGGTITIYNSNHLALSSTTGFQHYIWTFNGTNFVNPRPTIPGALFWDDYGQAAPPVPSYVPTTCPSSATNDYLATTIVSGGGSNNIVLANAATQTASGLTALFDDGPGLKAAFVSATTNPTSASVHLPASPTGTTYVINSHQVMPNTSATFLQSSSLTYNESVEFGGGLRWTGDLGGSCTVVNQFAFGPAACVNVGSAYPAVVLPAPATVTTVAFNGQSNGLLAILSQGGTFSSTFDHDQFAIPGSTDIAGGGLYMMGTSLTHIDHTLFSVNDTPTYGYSIAPMLASINNPANTQGAGSFTCDFCYAVGRGALVDSTPAVGSQQNYFLNSSYSQAIRTPWLTIGTANNAIIHVKGGTQDSSTQAMVSNQGANAPTVILDDVQNVSAESGGTPGILTGSPFSAVIANMSGTSLGQNMNVQRDRPNSNACLAGLSINGSNVCSSGSFPVNVELLDSPVHVGPAFDIFFPLSVPVPVSTSISGTSGGSVPVGAQVYTATAWGYDGNTTNPSASVTCTTTSGNQTCAPAFTFAAGTLFYSVYRNGQGVVACNHLAITASCSDTVASAGGGPAPAINVSGSYTAAANGTFGPCNTTYGIICSNQQTGATVDVRANACDTEAISVLGACDLRNETGSQTLAAPFLFGDSSQDPSVAYLPTSATWTATGTGCGIEQFGNTSLIGTDAAGAGSFRIGIGSTSVSYGYCTPPPSTGSTKYFYASGITVTNQGAGHPTSGTADFHFTNTFDQATWDRFTALDTQNTWGAIFDDTCCGSQAPNLNINMNAVSGHGGVLFNETNSLGPLQATRLPNFSVNHAGAGAPLFSYTDTRTVPQMDVVNGPGYSEVNGDATTTLSPIQGARAVSYRDWEIQCNFTSWGGIVVSTTNTFATNLTMDHIVIEPGTGGCAYPITVVSNASTGNTAKTDANGNFGRYDSAPVYVDSTLTTQQINQFAANSFAGVSACVGSTKTITFGANINFTSAPAVLLTDYTTAGGAKMSVNPTTTGFTVSCTGATDTFSWFAVGNAN